MVATGLAHPSQRMVERLFTLSISSGALNLPRLARLLRSLADDVSLVLDRSAAADTSLSTAELAAAAGLAERDIDRLASFGLLEGRTIGRETVFEGDALVVARLAAAFLEQGLEPRHLRMFKVAADREAGVYEQLVQSLTRQRDPDARIQAERRLGELADLGQQLRFALLRRAVRDVIAR